MITQKWLELGPAYGRDYKSSKEAKTAFEQGADFIMLSIGQGGTYCSRRDFAIGTDVILRYKKLTMICATKA